MIPKDDRVAAFRAHAVIVAKASAPESGSVAAPSHRQRGDWLIFADRGGVGRNLVKALEARGERCILVSPGDAYAAHDSRRFTIDPTSRADHERVIQVVSTDRKTPLQGVVHLWSLDQLDPAEPTIDLNRAMNPGCRSALSLSQALGAQARRGLAFVASDPERSAGRSSGRDPTGCDPGAAVGDG